MKRRIRLRDEELGFTAFNPTYGLLLAEKRLTIVDDIDILLLHIS